MQITLKAARVNAGMTIKEACNKLGISHSTLCKWEKNPGLINPIWQKQIGLAYGIDPDYIFFENEMDFKSISN